MLSKSLWLACLWFSSALVQAQIGNRENCTVGDEELPEVQSGINNFVIDMLGPMQFAFAIDQCTAANVLDTGRWYRYQCDMDSLSGMSTVTKTEYFDDACSGDGIVIETFNETNVTEGNRGFFECTGSNTYARIRMGLDEDCESTSVIYAGLGACFNFNLNQISMYCSSNETIAQVFNFLGQLPTSTFLPSSTFLPTSLNATLPTLINETIIPTLFNATLPEPTDLNATLNMTTTQFAQELCADEAFCDKWIFAPNQCRLIASLPLTGTLTSVYGIMEECFTDVMVSSTTMIELPSTTLENITVTEPTVPTVSTGGSTTSSIGTSTSTTRVTETTSGAVRPSLLFTVGMFFSFFFLVTV